MKPSPQELGELYPRVGAQGIADKYRVSKSTAYNWLRAAGISLDSPRRKEPQLARPSGEALRRQYEEEGLGLAELARRYGRRAETIKEWLVEAGGSIRGRGYGPSHAARHPRPTDEQLKTWWLDWQSAEETATWFGRYTRNGSTTG